jgi:hypothetical protein
MYSFIFGARRLFCNPRKMFNTAPYVFPVLRAPLLLVSVLTLSLSSVLLRRPFFTSHMIYIYRFFPRVALALTFNLQLSHSPPLQPDTQSNGCVPQNREQTSSASHTGYSLVLFLLLVHCIVLTPPSSQGSRRKIALDEVGHL